jgi:hypothetical protein
MPLPPELQSVLIWPIHAKGAVIKHNPLGDPKVEHFYHQALEDGRWLERNVASANHWLLQKKQYVQDKIKTCLDMNKLAVDGQLRHTPRKVKYIADAISFFHEINQFQQDILGLIAALTANITLLAQMEQNLHAMVQANLTALSLLLNNICNWGLPGLPSFPNLFPDGIFNWNGFKFSPLAAWAALKPNLNFTTNFSFSQCAILHPNFGNPAANPPASVTTYSGNSFGTPQFNPPLDGIAVPAGQNLADPDFIAQMRQTVAVAVYGPTFNPNSSMLGAVPDPSTILSDYQMPAQTYQNNIVSIVPSLRGNTVEPGDADYSNPNLAVRQPSLQQALTHFIDLDAVVGSNYDPYITSAWLFYLSITRNGRGGIWLPQYQDVFTTYITPSIVSLASNAVPWNNVLGGSGVNAVPTDIPLVDTLKLLPALALQTLLWKLSYVEASLLGYTRSKTWDAFQNGNYLSGVTGSDLDYVSTAVTFATTSTIALGLGTAEFPVPCVFPTAMTATLNQVIAQAKQDIQNDATYESPRLGNRFIYNQFAQATLVDRFTQFWRDFNTNMVSFLAQDPYFIQFAVTYFGILNGVLNPLGDKAADDSLQTDAAFRSRTWTPGTPLLPIPTAPIVAYANNTQPSDNATGWQGTQFNAQAFLARPDIQGQTIPVQNAMLRTNVSYAGLLQYEAAATSAIEEQIANTTALLQQSQEIGFSVTTDAVITTIPSGSPDVPVAFDTVIFDLTGNVTDSTTFTIQAAGEYAYFGSVAWQGTDSGQVRNVTVTQNGTAIFTQSTDPNFTSPLDLQISGYGNFAQGDVVQVLASHSFLTSEDVGAGSFFSMIQSGPEAPVIQIPANVPDDTVEFQTFVSMPMAPTAFFFQPDGSIAPIDPTVVRGHANAAITQVLVSGTTLTITVSPMLVPFSAGSTVFFSNVATATFLNGTSAVVRTSSATQFTATVDFSPYPVSSPPLSPPAPVADTGTASGGTVLFPLLDGITLAGVAYSVSSPPLSPPVGSLVSCGTTYGSMYQVSGANFTVGALFYVGLGGVLTQDYATLITEVQWIICAGRALTPNTIIYEPSLPFRIVSLS